LKFIVEKFD